MSEQEIIDAARRIGDLAEGEKIEWALAGGIAMYLYGSPRLTKDVDIIASGKVSLKEDAPLTFGGSNYTVEVGKYKVAVYWIVRSDGYARYYQKALSEAVSFPNGFQLISPEWLLILKMFAGRQKDYDDTVFLLKEKGLVDRPKIKENIVSVGGDDAWLATMANFRRLCNLAVEEPVSRESTLLRISRERI
jgi:hypothetical protein